MGNSDNKKEKLGPVLQELIRSFGDIVENCHLQDENGETWIFHAIRSGDPESVTHLVDHHKVDMNIMNNEGVTPLHLAALVGSKDINLVVWGAENIDLNARTSEPVTVGDRTLREGSNVLDILAQRGEEFHTLLDHIICFVHDNMSRRGSTYDVTATACAIEMARQKLMRPVKESRRISAARREVLSPNEVHLIGQNKDVLLRMKTLPVMSHLCSKGAMCDYDRKQIVESCKGDKVKAAEYILDDVILKGSYEHLQHFREGLIKYNQKHLADLLPQRRH